MFVERFENKRKRAKGKGEFTAKGKEHFFKEINCIEL